MRHIVIVILVLSVLFYCNQKPDSAVSVSTNQGVSYETIVAALMDTDVDSAMELLAAGRDVNEANKYGDTPLIWASEQGNLDLAKALLGKGADPNKTGSYSKTALHWAAGKGHVELCETLLASGSKLEALDKKLQTPFHFAVERGQLKTAKLLRAKGAGLEAADEHGRTPLMAAMEHGKLPLIYYLISEGANLDAKSSNGKTPFSIAVNAGYGQFLRTPEFRELVPDINKRLEDAYVVVVENEADRPELDLKIMAKRLHVLINKERKAHGLKPLGYDGELAKVADSHSEDMAQKAFFSHVCPEGRGPKERALAMNYKIRENLGNGRYKMGIGENIYMSKVFSGTTATFEGNKKHMKVSWLEEGDIAARAVKGWMESPGHRENVLNTTYKRQGFGFGISENDDIYITQNFF